MQTNIYKFEIALQYPPRIASGGYFHSYRRCVPECGCYRARRASPLFCVL